MKSQDIGLLLKLVALRSRENHGSNRHAGKGSKALPDDWRDWALDDVDIELHQDCLPGVEDDQLLARYSVRALAEETGISKSQVSLALQRCLEVGLIRKDRRSGVPRTNARALFNFIVHGVRYVFPAKPGEITRGIATTFAAPVLEGQLYSSGELLMVWPDARGNSKGQAIEPLFKSVSYAVRRDRELYAMLALVDAIRLGHPRESKLAAEKLAEYLE
ncbi:MarR family transcriptional regulator [Halomonas sp. THAF12]|uniref:MarR family transcriptional regulator n=1 Tax=Halomonas sp. B23F22_10 TaxID=3459515 RepID=UPI00373F87B6